MATNIALITDALRLLGVIAETESPSAEQGSHALDRMNRMIEAWTEDEIELGWYEQTLTTDDAPLPKWAERGVVSKLAQDLRAFYPASSLETSIHDDSQNGFGTIRRRAILDQMSPADLSHMPLGSGRLGGGWDIESDS